jgi:diguanylate cyclase (GGDEF)-like protein
MFYPALLGLDGGSYSFWYIYPITLSLGFLFIGILSERGLYCFYGFSKILIVLVLLCITYYFLTTFSNDLRVALDTSIFNFDISNFIKLNHFTFLISIFSLTFITIISSFVFTGAIEKALAWTLIALLIPAFFTQEASSFILFSILSSLIVISALLKDVYTMSYIDTLTQIPGRRALEEAFLKLGSTYTIAMVDIDFFKKFNDKYGHDVGDDVLKLIAQQLKEVKGSGEAFRYGGEEFTLLFANKTADETLLYLEEVREAIAKRAFIPRNKNRPKEEPKNKIKPKKTKAVTLTVSIGVANSPKNGKNPQDIMKCADLALYKAKESGRNCTKIY